MKAIYILFILGIASACSSTKELSPMDVQQIESRNALTATKSYTFVATRAFPMASGPLQQLANRRLLGMENTSGMIQLQGNSNYLHILKDSVSMFLPFYGERQMGAAIGKSAGIEVMGSISDYNVLPDSKKNTEVIRFSAREGSERYDVTMTVFPSLKTDVVVTSTQRTTIRYEGRLSPYKEENGDE